MKKLQRFRDLLFLMVTLAAILTQVTACKTNTVTGNGATDSVVVAPTKAGDTLSNDTSGNARLALIFYSIGEGPNNEAMRALEDTIANYSTRTGKQIKYDKNSWGREGETDFCMSLNELSTPEQEAFVKHIRQAMEKERWINIYENYRCKDRRRR